MPVGRWLSTNQMSAARTPRTALLRWRAAAEYSTSCSLESEGDVKGTEWRFGDLMAVWKKKAWTDKWHSARKLYGRSRRRPHAPWWWRHLRLDIVTAAILVPCSE